MSTDEKIREVMQWSGVTQKDLARRMGMKYTTLNGYLCGHNRIPLDVIKQIASALHVSVFLLINEEPLPADSMELTQDERAIINRYRQLTMEQQEIIAQSMDLYFRHNQEKNVK